MSRSIGIPLERLISQQKEQVSSNARWLLIYLAAQSGYPLTVIASYLGVYIAGVSLAPRAIEKDVQVGDGWRRKLEMLGREA